MYITKAYLGTEWIWIYRSYASSAMWTQCGTSYPVKRTDLPSPFFRTAEFEWEEMQKRAIRSISKRQALKTRSSAFSMEVERRCGFSF